MPTTQKDRVRKASPEKINSRIDQQTIESLDRHTAAPGLINKRLKELEKEWDMERVLELNASLIALAGVLLSTKNKRWLFLPGIVTSFLAQHALQGWCPPVPLFRALGYRTRREIDREKYALKALRGDFDRIHSVKDAYNKAD